MPSSGIVCSLHEFARFGSATRLFVWTGRWTVAAFPGYTVIKHGISSLAVGSYEENGGGCQNDEDMSKIVRERLVNTETLLHSPDGVGTKRSSVTAVPGVVS